MKLVTLTSDIPRAKRKRKVTPLDKHEAYLQLRHMILEGRMKPYQQIGLFLGPEDQKSLDMKWPWRTAADRLRALVREIGAEADYHIKKFETDTPGVWFVRVTYNPPEAATTPRKTRKRA